MNAWKDAKMLPFCTRIAPISFGYRGFVAYASKSMNIRAELAFTLFSSYFCFLRISSSATVL